MKLTILGPAHPYRGGLASIMQTMARVYQHNGHEVDVCTFTLQYPSLLFPGKSQTVSTPAPKDLKIRREVSTVNPFNWLRVGQMLRRERPDFILLKYWTPFMAPCFGTIARLARKNGHTKVLCQIDNVEPHEKHLIDKPCNSYFLRAVDGFVYMSDEVFRQLRNYTEAPALFSPHPRFENFGERIDRTEACAQLELDPTLRYALFFGLIRDYKGLDLLLKAWGKLKRQGKTAGRKLIVAGEFYTAPEPYKRLVDEQGIADEVILHDRFIPDSVVGAYFSAADFVVLPYRSATQSGVTQIAYQFSTPMIVTDVGGLGEIVPDQKVGYLCRPEVDSIAEKIDQIWQGDNLERFHQNCLVERERFSWEEMCAKLMAVYERVK